MLKIGDKKLINAWAFYDWANSVYSLVISTAVFPIYYSNLTESFQSIEGKVTFLGTEWDPTTLYDYTMALSFLIVAFLSPILSGIADYKGNKLGFLKTFCLIGSLSVMSLFFFEGESTLWVAILFTILASIGFWGSIVFYNAYLPEVAHPENQDRVSAKGFINGYAGSILLLILCLVLIEMHETFGLEKGLATRLSFILVGLWWLGFAQITYKKLPNHKKENKGEEKVFWKGLAELKLILKELKHQPHLKVFLWSFFLFSIGVQTIILMAGIFGSKELELETSELIAAILLVQFVAIGGAAIFSRLSKRHGNIMALKTTIIIWAVVCLAAFFIEKGPNANYYFYGLGGLIGLVMGAIQSLSRSTYSKLLPETEDHATYFSFYDVTEKIAIVVGMVTFGVLISITGSMNYSVLCLAVFFIASFVVLSFLEGNKYVK
ncbi:MAG: MFS transporter [Flavobacteriaceae bacterium]